MKKAILGLAMFATTFAFARTWTITTSCGTTVTKNISDNATISQIKDAVSQVNLNECGVRPTSITLTI
ncbi:hypothetical protein NZ698_09850 [Chryseobacterium sp. PBS4-4]|uniref:Uncharacterized protein n=1 Tax=Chryseobacterium edaphi TaxID=2976532 RepID=A0ABT2W5L9_9FLAO|nr:hypothetical protein [Chryseobacterium edaphi]MCU7617499.1 hypothetical protein [Chryseobacterium edaphi]